MMNNNALDPDPIFKQIVSKNLVEKVYAQLREAIIRGDIVPGERISEAEIARHIGISRGPVREAARMLEQQGLLVAIPRRGFFVKTFSLKELDDLFGLRSCLEMYAAKHAYHRILPTEIAALRTSVEQMKAHARSEDPLAFMDVSLDFHRKICELSENERLITVFDEVISVFKVICLVAVAKYINLEDNIARHSEILEALENGEKQSFLDKLETFLEEARLRAKELFVAYERLRASAS